MEQWKCSVCGYIHTGPIPEGFACPRCKQPASAFVKMEEKIIPGNNPYAGTKTEKNLAEAFAGESQARNKYTYFANVASREGYDQLAEIFLKTARNEQEHARVWFEELGHINGTAANLLAAAPDPVYGTPIRSRSACTPPFSPYPPCSAMKTASVPSGNPSKPSRSSTTG